MKTTNTIFKLVLAAVVLLGATEAHAKIWRVNNQSNYNGVNQFGDNLGGTPVFPVFKQIGDAMLWPSVSEDGTDTLHIEGSTTQYANATINKPVVIIGNGYFLTENPKTSSNVSSASIGNVTFVEGSSGSSVIGMRVVSSNNLSINLYSGANNIKIQRCWLYGNIRVWSPVTDIYVLQNFFPTSNNAIFSLTNPISNLVFNHNILQRALDYTASEFTQCNNNVFDGPTNSLNIEIYTAEFRNNILKATGATVNINDGTNLNVEFATCTQASQFGGTPNVVIQPNMNLVFQTEGSTDGIYQLNETWAAANPGSNGDRGAFGGAPQQRYTLSGLAPIPVIYSVSSTGLATPGEGLPVTIKARTIK